MTKVCGTEDQAAVVVVASYRSVPRNPVRFKALGAIGCVTLSKFESFTINPIQYGGGGGRGHCGFSFAASKPFGVGRSNFQTFSTYVSQSDNLTM